MLASCELRAGRARHRRSASARHSALLHGACGGPAAFYKDANPRNFLITPAGPVTVDFDDLTLAPFGYDLAKLVVTLAMTYGALDPRRSLPRWVPTTPLPAICWG